MHLPTTTLILYFPSLLCPSSTCFSIHPRLLFTRNFRQPVHVCHHSSAQLIHNYFRVLAFLWPHPILKVEKRRRFLQERAPGPGNWIAGGGRGCACPRGFSDTVLDDDLILKKPKQPQSSGKGSCSACALADERCHLHAHPEGSRVGCCQSLQADHQVATSFLQGFADVLQGEVQEQGGKKRTGNGK